MNKEQILIQEQNEKVSNNEWLYIHNLRPIKKPAVIGQVRKMMDLFE